MIDCQLRVSGVNDARVLAAMNAVPRERFVPAGAHGHAYIDRAIPLDCGQMLPAPLVQGQMLTEALPAPGERVLLVSTASSYLGALVEAMGALVETISPAAAASASGLTTRHSGSYSLLLIDGAVEHLPAGLTDRLAADGRVVTGLVLRGVTRLASGRKLAGKVQLLPLAELGIPVLAEFAAPKSWSF